MDVHVTPAAENDLADALNWYDNNAPGVGLRLLDEFDALISRIAEGPRQFPRVQTGVHRAGFRDFPYGLFYSVARDRVTVFACVHTSRDPLIWQRRAQ
jgi:plasmid stabilization system protein ParE